MDNSNNFNMHWSLDELMEDGEKIWNLPNTCFFPIFKWFNDKTNTDITLGNIFFQKYYIVLDNSPNYINGEEYTHIAIGESNPDYMKALKPHLFPTPPPPVIPGETDEEREKKRLEEEKKKKEEKEAKLQ